MRTCLQYISCSASLARFIRSCSISLRTKLSKPESGEKRWLKKKPKLLGQREGQLTSEHTEEIEQAQCTNRYFAFLPIDTDWPFPVH